MKYVYVHVCTYIYVCVYVCVNALISFTFLRLQKIPKHNEQVKEVLKSSQICANAKQIA